MKLVSSPCVAQRFIACANSGAIRVRPVLRGHESNKLLSYTRGRDDQIILLICMNGASAKQAGEHDGWWGMPDKAEPLPLLYTTLGLLGNEGDATWWGLPGKAEPLCPPN